MSIRSGLVTFLKVAVGNSRVYSLRMPQSPSYPLIVYTIISTEDQITYEGPLSLKETAVQLDFWSKKIEEVDALEQVVKEALVGYKGPMGDIAYTAGWKRESVVDMYESDTGLYRIAVDYRGKYSEV